MYFKIVPVSVPNYNDQGRYQGAKGEERTHFIVHSAVFHLTKKLAGNPHCPLRIHPSATVEMSHIDRLATVQ